jgi:N-acetylmuramoyl-L-alanine amidase
MKIVLDAGHGPNTLGKRTPDDSMREFHFNSDVADYIAAELRKYEGVEILFVHEKSIDVSLKDRTDKANEWKADLYLSIHANAFGVGGWNNAQGVETFVYTTRPAAAVALANAVQRRLIKATGRPDRGVKSANFHVLRETNMTAILVECGFMTNMQEAELLKSDDYRRKCAAAIVAGLVETYGLKKMIEEEPPKPLPLIQRKAKVVMDGTELDGYLINDRTYIPVRFVTENLGGTVVYDIPTKTTFIRK